MDSSDEIKIKKRSTTQIKRATKAFAKKMSRPNLPVEPEAAALEWVEAMSRARISAKILWDAYLSEDPESFHDTVERLKPGTSEIRLLLDIAYHEPSPDTASKLGVASAARYEPTIKAIREDWAAAQKQGAKKMTKEKFVGMWIDKRDWKPPLIKMSEEKLYDCLPKKKRKK